MEQQLTLATRKSLFSLLSFLDSRLPEYCAVNCRLKLYFVANFYRTLIALDPFLHLRNPLDSKSVISRLFQKSLESVWGRGRVLLGNRWSWCRMFHRIQSTS